MAWPKRPVTETAQTESARPKSRVASKDPCFGKIRLQVILHFDKSL